VVSFDDFKFSPFWVFTSGEFDVKLLRVYPRDVGEAWTGKPVCGRHNPGATEEENMVGFHHDDEYTPEDQHRT